MRFNIGVDVGGTTIKSGIVDDLGKILFTDVIDTKVELGFEKIAHNLINSLNNLISKSRISIDDIDVIGIGIPGVADKSGFVHHATNLYWKNVPLSERVRAAFPNKKIFVQNDATIAAVAEKKIGKLKDIDNGLLLTLGTGIGGGIIINGRPFSGAHLIGSEVGHMIIGENNFYDCSCGNNGCFETYCSASAVSKYIIYRLKNGAKSSVMKYVDNIEDVTTKLVFQEFEKKDPLSIEVIDRYIDYFGKGISSLINILDPEIILIGGGLSKSFHLFEDRLNEEVDKRILHKNLGRARICTATLGNNAGIIGGSMLGEFY